MIAVAALLLAGGTATLDAMVKAATVCPPPAAGEITVCGRRDAERSRYLSPIPAGYDVGDPRARSAPAERNGLFDYDAGGAGSCSTVGPNGAFGCFAKAEQHRIEQRAGARDPADRFTISDGNAAGTVLATRGYRRVGVTGRSIPWAIST